MTRFRKQLIAGVAALGMLAGSLSAFAQTTANAQGAQMSRPAHGNGKTPEQMKERMAARQAELHRKLQLTPGQEAAWTAYAEKMQFGAHPARPDRAEIAQLTAPERMEKRLAMLQEMEKRMAVRVVATREFYAVLTPEQKKIFDSAFAHRSREHGRHRAG